MYKRGLFGITRMPPTVTKVLQGGSRLYVGVASRSGWLLLLKETRVSYSTAQKKYRTVSEHWAYAKRTKTVPRSNQVWGVPYAGVRSGAVQFWYRAVRAYAYVLCAHRTLLWLILELLVFDTETVWCRRNVFTQRWSAEKMTTITRSSWQVWKR